MSWTYDGTPSLSSRDAVRFLTGQTSSGDDVLVQDEEIDFALGAATNNTYGASAVVCDALASRFAQYPDQESIGQLGLSWNDRAQKYRERAKELRGNILTVSGVSPYVGGMTISGLQTDRADTDLVQPAAWIGMDDNPRRSPLDGSGSTGVCP